MAFLLIDGVEYEAISDGSGASAEVQYVGGKIARMFDRTIRSSVKETKDVLTFLLFDMNRAALEALIALTDLGRPVPIGGDAVASSFVGSVRVVEYGYVRDGVGHLYRPTVEITQQ